MEQLQQQAKKHSTLYYVIAGIALIMFWRGLWGLMDIYLFPENQVLSYAASAAVGLFLLYINDFKLKELG